MIFKPCVFATAVFFCFCTVSASAHAGQLFPPNNIGSNPNVACPNGGVLTWNVDHVDCVNPTPGVSVSCPAGTVLQQVVNGNPTCLPDGLSTAPASLADDYISCHANAEGQCTSGEEAGITGLQVLPSGLIMQWGAGWVDGEGDVPLFQQFPHRCFQVFANDCLGGLHVVATQCNDADPSTVHIWGGNSGGQLEPTCFRYFAIGN